MRLVLASSDLAVGGAERNLVTYACALSRRGHEVEVAAGDGALASELAACGIPRLNMKPHLRKPLSLLTSATTLRKAHQRRPINVVHSFMASASVAAALARSNQRHPFGLISAPPGIAQGRRESMRLSHLRLRLLAMGSDVVLSPSADLREHLLASGVGEGRIRSLDFNAVDLGRFSEVTAATPDSIGAKPGERLICAVARLHPVKGQDLLIRAAALIRKSVPNVRVILVGDGQWRQNLEALAAAERVEDIVTFLGNRNDVPAILKAVDVVVQTTFGTGGPGLSVLEAFAARRPVVGFAFGDLVDAVGDTGAALLVERDDVQGFASAILKVLGDPALASQMGDAGRALVERRYDTEHVLDQLEPVYEEVASAARRR